MQYATCIESLVGWASRPSRLGGQDAHPTISQGFNDKVAHHVLILLGTATAAIEVSSNPSIARSSDPNLNL